MGEIAILKKNLDLVASVLTGIGDLIPTPLCEQIQAADWSEQRKSHLPKKSDLLQRNNTGGSRLPACRIINKNAFYQSC